MSTSNFYGPEAVKPLYDEIVPAYQSAFAGEPWFEVSKCADRRLRCIGGLSSAAVGSTCTMCNSSPELPAYEPTELIDRFEGLAASRPTAWYAEQAAEGISLAAISWRAKPSLIAEEKYADNAPMAEWLEQTLGVDDIGWLDEVFANKALRVAGNLRNFGAMCNGFMERLETNTLAFRTINERMIAASNRDFGAQATVYERNVAVPDRREFVVLRGTL